MTAVVPEIRVATVSPAAIGDNETIVAYRVRQGDMILAMWVILEVQAGTVGTATATIGDGGDVDGFGTDTQMDPGGTAGAYTQLGIAGLGYPTPHLYTADDTIDVTYVAGTAAGVVPRWKIFMIIVSGARA